ncbi:MAG: choice-of-anchor L domain-containing protein [Deltaproteobacteria bacterium]|nr:choice-of-anchor L domain-containing protein [Deltaproteobacteria bacterium]
MTNHWTSSLLVSSVFLWGCGSVELPGDDDDADSNETPTTNSPPDDDDNPPGPVTGGAATGGAGTTTMGEGGSTEGPIPPPPIIFDVGEVSDLPPGSCFAPPQINCDHMDDDPWHALGLNCPGGPQVEGSITLQGPEQLYVQEGNLGTFNPPTYPPREGNKFVILSSGNAQEMTIPGFYASTDVGGFGDNPLLPPIVTNSVSATDDCVANPALVGTGDCSNTIETQWNQGSGSYDYAEMRLVTEVPPGVPGFTYDFAMFSTEYPVYYQSGFNDMYIAWLESEQWTGNVSFDDMGNPISLNAGFLDFKDAPNDFDCPAPCSAPELMGTAMEGHAGTRWLTTTAGVTPGETIEVIFAVFDLSDGILDTVVLLDNFQWACAGGGPSTIPG